MSDNEPTYFSYEETFKIEELRPYDTMDNEGRKVQISPKVPSAHESHHLWEQLPTFFYNLGKILIDPDRVEPSLSQNPDAVKHRQEGEVLIFEKDDYMFALGAPFVPKPIGDTVSVIVKYDREKGENYTLTYRLDKK